LHIEQAEKHPLVLLLIILLWNVSIKPLEFQVIQAKQNPDAGRDRPPVSAMNTDKFLGSLLEGPFLIILDQE
jgi:hypothetical protein